jgi:hypothetical protein
MALAAGGRPRSIPSSRCKRLKTRVAWIARRNLALMASALEAPVCSVAESYWQVGGARRDRTDDLLLAKQALSQLSYGPGRKPEARNRKPDPDQTSLALDFDLWLRFRLTVVGLGRLELPTSRLSGVRSNHLSYRPDAFAFASCLKKEKRRRRKSRSGFKDPVRFLNRSVV